MRKVYKKLTKEQIARDIIFSSCLSEYREEMQSNTIHEIKKGQSDADEVRVRLLNDKFFNNSSYNFNIIRQ